MTSVPKFYRYWFYAAALYNVVWGIVVVLFTSTFHQLAGVDASVPHAFFQCIGMMVGVFAFGYYLLARNPERYQGFIWIGLAGKTLGPIGTIFAVSSGHLASSFLWVNLTNDIIWLPVFTMFALKYARRPV